ncbi:MAG: cryptochrome/photolyase family protein [Methyloceanibacter sp.]|uniref:cryptochrome/photolyase family protein n=1 Tax=Methyloceanibacter sp. TaxID=1965321 RepID=UPI003D9B8362
MSQAPIIVWFRRDLRLADNVALTEAAHGAPILPLYILDDETPGRFRAGGASRWWLHGSLSALNADLTQHGGALCLRRGASPDVLAALLDETGARAIHVARAYEPWDASLAKTIAEICKDKGAVFRQFSGQLLFEPEDINTADGAPFRVFTPFWKACRTPPPPRAPLPRPKKLLFAEARSDSLDAWHLRPTRPDWADGLRATWKPGEAAAQHRLAQFLDRHLANYADDRSSLDVRATSLMSPSLHFGELSPNQIWRAVTSAAEANGKTQRGAESFLREIGWREFCHHLLFNFPKILTQPLRPEFENFPWRDDEAPLRAWQKGQAGYPIVDAAMRELWHTGFMPNRARMVVASFLVKHLLVPWQRGADWFLDTLVDADLASNQANWQWVAGSGADAAPYFRIFNPVLQGQKFDPSGDYVRRFVPELAKLSTSDIHAPWDAPGLALAEAGITLGETYPMPLIEHGRARKRALAAFETIKHT